MLSKIGHSIEWGLKFCFAGLFLLVPVYSSNRNQESTTSSDTCKCKCCGSSNDVKVYSPVSSAQNTLSSTVKQADVNDSTSCLQDAYEVSTSDVEYVNFG